MSRQKQDQQDRQDPLIDSLIDANRNLISYNHLLLQRLTSSESTQKESITPNNKLRIQKQLQQARYKRDINWSELDTAREECSKAVDKLDPLNATYSSQCEQIRKLQEEITIAKKNDQTSQTSSLTSEHKHEISLLNERIAQLESENTEREKLRKKLHNTILELKGKIRVFCRVRPFLSDDDTQPEAKVSISFPTSMESSGRGIDLNQNGQKHSFTFDKVFIPSSTQEDVFVEISQLVQSALDGDKVSIFAYGQTGSGKTYTMMGNPGISDQKGLIPRTLEQVFETRQSLQAQGWKYDVKVGRQASMLEIYNETIRDLIPNRGENAGMNYSIDHHANGNTFVSDLSIVDVCSRGEVSYLLDLAAQSRPVGRTQMNEQSSRSHFVFTLRIEGENESTKQQVHGVLNLIDLAGSERLSKSGCAGDRLKETQAIDKSLSSLSDVIFALVKKDGYVPFNNSKLTYLLQPCLGGDSKKVMLVNISLDPDPTSAAETLCSLRFAEHVMIPARPGS